MLRSNTVALAILFATLAVPLRGEVIESIELSYAVGSFRAGGFRNIPTVVDRVLRGQLARLKALVETGRPD